MLTQADASMKIMQTVKSMTGITLIELMVVITIIALIGAVVGPQVFKQLAGAKSKTAKMQIEDFGAALDLFYIDAGRYPDTNEGLQALVQAPAGMEQWNGPYIKKNMIPKDPWDNDYHYQSPGENGPYDLYSYGSDNAPGGENDRADIVSWE
jgi:general secretion pathway protein G